MKSVAILLVLLCLLLGAHGGEAEVDQLALKLGSVSFREREDADAALRALERDVVPFLRKHKKSRDPEIKQRISEIIAHLAAKPLTLRFADTNLTAGIKDQYGLDILTDKSVKGVTSLKLQGRGITNLAGIAQLPELSSLDLDRNGVSDVSELAKLMKLRYLKLQYNSITNIAPLLKSMDKRDPAVSLHLYLTGNPLRRETASKDIAALKSLGVSIRHLWTEPLPEDWEVRFSKPVLRPYERMHIYVIPKPAEDALAAYKEHGMLRVDDGAGTVQAEGAAEPTPLKSLYVNWSGGRKWLLFTQSTKIDESVRQREPGTYTYNLVVRAKETLWTCPPIKLKVEIPEKDRGMLEEFERTKASSFLKHDKGYRTVDEEGEPAIPYDKLLAFLEKYPDSYLNSIVCSRAVDLMGGDISYDRKVSSSDKKALARVGVLSNERFIETGKELLTRAQKDLARIKGDAQSSDTVLRRAEDKVYRAKEWFKHVEDYLAEL